MVDDSRPFQNLSNILHRLGHELHSDLTEDIWRRDAARRFEKSLQVPINRAKIQKAAIGTAKFPMHSRLGPHCGDCTLLTAKKPIQRLRGTLRRRISEVQIDQKHSTITITGSGHQQRHRRRRNPRRKMSKMCDSATQTGPVETKMNEYGGTRINGSFSVTEVASDSVLGKFERKMDGKVTFKKRSTKKKTPQKAVIEAPPPLPLPPPPSTVEAPPKEISMPQRKPRKQTCFIAAPEDAIAAAPRDQQLYAPVELHCAAEAAVKAIDRSITALEKLILLAPKNSIEKSLLKTISLMCVFLRQFHTELRTKKDRRSKLEIILRIWDELQKQASQGIAPIPAPSEVRQQKASAMTSAAPPSIAGEALTVKPIMLSPCSSNTIDTFGAKKS